jgi:hypothetical protein
MADWDIVDENREEGFFVSSLNYGEYFEIMQKYNDNNYIPPRLTIHRITLSRRELLSLGVRINEVINDTSRVYGDMNGSKKH